MNSVIHGPPPSILVPWTTGILILRPSIEHRLLQEYKETAEVILRFANNIKHIMVCVEDDAQQLDWVHSTLGKMIKQDITPETLVPLFANARDRNNLELGYNACNDERRKRLQCLDIVSCTCRADEKRTGFSALRKLVFQVDTKKTITLLVSLLSLISSLPDSPFECLLISDVNSEDIRTMKREGLGEKCANLWPRLRRLSVLRSFSVYDTEEDEDDERDDESDWDESEESVSPLSSIVDRCSKLLELTLTTNLEIPLDLPGLLPTLRVLIIRIYRSSVFCCDEHDSLVESNFPYDIVGSGRFPALQALYIQLPYKWSEVHERKVEPLMKKLSTDCDSNNVSFVIQKW